MVALWAGASIHAQQAMEHPRWEDFEYERDEQLRGNRLAWLGNGMTLAQRNGEDTTGYLEHADIPPPIVPGVELWDPVDPGWKNGE